MVAECALIGYKDRDALTRSKADVVCRQGSGVDALARELQESVKNRVGPSGA
jgi:acyl-coenzyme A synthetase/AMP-(fatty) acid ligase